MKNKFLRDMQPVEHGVNVAGYNIIIGWIYLCDICMKQYLTLIISKTNTNLERPSCNSFSSSISFSSSDETSETSSLAIDTDGRIFVQILGKKTTSS